MEFQNCFPVWDKLNTSEKNRIPKTLIARMLKYFPNEGMVKLSRSTIKITDSYKSEELSDKQTMSVGAKRFGGHFIR